MAYHLKNIRTLLTKGFSTEELRRLCQDTPGLRDVLDELAPTIGKVEMVDRIIDFANRRNLIHKLLAEAREANDSRYQQHQPYTEPIYNEVLDILREQDWPALNALLAFLDQNTWATVRFDHGDDRRWAVLITPPSEENPDGDMQRFPDLTPGRLRLFHALEVIFYSAEDDEVRILKKGSDLLRHVDMENFSP